ncbi:MAG: hypothetical protein V4631_18670 [Pseudomonadota bacterium]
MKYLHATILLLASLNSYATSSTASESVAVFNGLINEETVDQFLRLHEDRLELKEISIASQGGEVGAALKLARWVRLKKLNVRVRMICFSACANYIFVAGEKKYIEPGAFVAWHGDVEQKDFRDFVAEYKRIADKKLQFHQLEKNEIELLEKNNEKYKYITRLQIEQLDLFQALGINPIIGRIGQEPVMFKSDGWSFTVKAMEYFGITNIIAPTDYGSFNYFRRNPAASFVNGGPLLIFDVDSAGNIMPMNP